MMGLRKRAKASMPDDPLAPVMTRIVSTAEPVFDAWWMPGMWTGNGCHLAGLQAGSTVDDARLEQMVAASGGAFDIVMTELPALIKATAIRGGEHDEVWYRTFMRYVVSMLPDAVAEVWEHEQTGLQAGHAKFIGAIYPHPIPCCWPVDTCVYHAHCIVLGTVACDCPDCG